MLQSMYWINSISIITQKVRKIQKCEVIEDSEDGWTMLYAVIWKDYEAVVKLLIAHENINAKTVVWLMTDRQTIEGKSN